jgi:hypothetical protein
MFAVKQQEVEAAPRQGLRNHGMGDREPAADHSFASPDPADQIRCDNHVSSPSCHGKIAALHEQDKAAGSLCLFPRRSIAAVGRSDARYFIASKTIA